MPFVSQPIQTGFQGTGFIADFHARALQALPDVQLAAVCDPVQERAERFAKRWNVPRVYTSVEAMLAGSPLQAVHVLIPPLLHAAAVETCLAHDCALFVEKPLAVTAEDCRRLTRLYAESGSKNIAGVNQNYLSQPAFQKVVNWVKDCRLGAVEHVIAYSSVPLRQLAAGDHGHWMFREPGNIILEQAPHPLSQIVYLLGRVKQASTLVSGGMRLSNGSMFHRKWQVSLMCERGTAQCYFQFGAEHRDSWVHVLGQDAAAIADLRRDVARLSEKTRYLDPVDDLWDASSNAVRMARQGIGNFTQFVRSTVQRKPGADAFSRSFCNSIRAFYAARQGGPAFPASFEHATAVMEACEAVIESALGSASAADQRKVSDYALVP